MKSFNPTKIVEESKDTPSPTTIRSPRIHSNPISLDTEKLQELTINDPPPSSSTPSSSSPKPKLSTSQHILSLFMPRKKFHVLAQHLQEIMEESLPKMDDLPIWLALKYKFERLHVSNTSCRPFVVRLRDQDDPHDDAHLEGENSPSTLGNQEQLDDFDFWTNSYATDDDELPTKKVSQELVEEMLQTVNEAKLRKVVNEMLRQRCTSGDEHQHHIDQMKNLLKNGIMTMLRLDYCIEKYKMFSIISKPIYGIKYKNSKKEKKVMRHQEVHKFCDATLKRVLEGLKSYNNNVKHSYVTQSLSKEDAEYLQLFEEEIEEWLKHHDQMRRWKTYVNGRPLGSRREHPK
ncbi:hypothetical protein Tco_0649214 [Tanacetum coccineum]